MKSLYGVIGKWVGGVAAISSIVGLVIAFCSDKNAVIISLITFCFVLVATLVSVLLTLAKVLKQNYPEPYERISSFYEFRSDDGQKSTFESYRLIQSKRAVLTHIEYKFKWSGTKQPVVSSNSQVIRPVISSHDANSWDKCDMYFKKPLTYNECAVVHFKTENDDYDGKAEPVISTKLDTPIEVMQYKVLLSYKPDNYMEKARFERKRIDSDVEAPWEYLESVDFNPLYKQYQHVVVAPEPGYFYRIRWVK